MTYTFRRTKSLLIGALLFLPVFSHAAVFNDAADGNWNSGATWGNPGNDVVGSGYPGSSDTATIDSNTVTLSADSTVSGVTISGGILNGSSSILSIGTGGWTFTSGAFNPDTGTVKFTNAATITGTTTFNNFTFNTGVSTNNLTLTMTGYTMTVNGTLTVDNTSTGAMKMTGGVLEARGDIVWDASNSGTITTSLVVSGTGTQTLTHNNATLTSGNFIALTINKSLGTFVLPAILHTNSNWVYIQGTLDTTTNNSTVVFTGISGGTISGSHTLNNVRFDQNSSTNVTFSMSATVTVSGTLTIDNASTGDIKINTGTIAIEGDALINTTKINTGATGVLLFSGSNNQTLTLSGGSTTAGAFMSTNINKTAGTLTISGDLRTAKSFTHTAGNVDWTTNAATLSLNGALFFNPGSSTYNDINISSAGAVTLSADLLLNGNWINSGSFTSSSYGVTFTGSGTSTLTSNGTSTTKDFENLTIAKTGNGTVQLASSTDIDGTLSITSGTLDINGQSLSTVTTCTNSGTLKLTGDETLSCTPTLSATSTVEYSATSGTRAIKNWNYGNLKINGAGGTFTDTGTRTLVGDFILSAGTFQAPSTFNVPGNFLNTGTFTHASGTVSFTGVSQTITGSAIFNNFSKIVTSSSSLIFDNTATTTILGALTLTGTAGNLLYLRSDIDGQQWEIDPQGTRTVNYVDVKDSHNVNATSIDNNNTTNSGNNTNWTTTVNGPTITMTSPTEGAIISGTTTVSADATDDVAVLGVQFKLDGVNIGTEDTTSPYSISWDSTTATEGSHVITAVARDGDSNTTTATGMNIVVDNATSSITQYGITWTFDQEYQYGQYVNGDYWVVGPVTINSITPDATTGRNGWEINPQSHGAQPYDDRSNLYSSSSLPILPNTVPGESSVVKTISAVTGTHTFVQTAAVLTVLSSVPTDRGTTLFRPPYYGTSKPSYSVNDMDLSVLPSLASVTGAPTLSNVASDFQKVQLDHIQGWDGRYIHPVDNMPNYGADISNRIAEGVLRLELNDTTSEKRQAGIMMTQMGIDWYQLRASGQNWSANGGHELGRKLAILFAGVVLNNQSMKDVVSNGVDATYQENGQITTRTQANDGNGLPVWGQTNTEHQYWYELANPNAGSKVIYDPYGYIDGGYAPGWVYQELTAQPYKNLSIATRLLPNGSAIWNDVEFFEYVDRWATVGAWTQPDPCAPYDGVNNDPNWDANYGITFGPDGSGGCILDTNPGDGIGRLPLSHGDNVNSGTYGSTFASNMYTAYSSTVDAAKPILISVSSTTAATTATITWSTNESATSTVSYGMTTSYGLASSSATSTTSHSITLTNLTASTTYHFQVASADALGNTATSTDYTFTTSSGIPDTTPPIVSLIASSTTATTATITWSTNESATSSVNYGTTTSYSSASSSASFVTSHSIILTGLTELTIYHFQISVSDVSGNVATSSDYVFTTATSMIPDTTAPVITVTGSNPITINQGTVYTDAGATAVDAVDGDVTSSIISTSTVDSSVIGTYYVTYDARDGAGNYSYATRTVDVVASGTPDTTSPTITITGSNPTSVTQNTTYTDAGATASDAVDGTVSVTTTNTIDTATTGTQYVTYSAHDSANNYAYATRTVTITAASSGGGSSSGGGGSTKKSTSTTSTTTGIVSTPTSTTPSTEKTSYSIITTYAINLNTAPDLELNTISPYVTTLQKFLNAIGYMVATTGAGSPGYETTTFWYGTEEALKRFQLDNNLPGTGIFGPKTRAVIFDMYGKNTVSRPSNNTTSVEQLLMLLLSLQKQLAEIISAKSATTPTVNNPTVVTLAQTLTTAPDLELNDDSAYVTTLQKFLNAIGYTVATTGVGSPGNETTTFWYGTEEALKRFQLDNNLPGTGIFGPKTRAVISEWI